MQSSDKLLILVLIATVIGVLSFFTINFLAILGAVKIGNSCFMRYNAYGTAEDLITQKVIVNANGQYSVPLDQNSNNSPYGQWVRSEYYFKPQINDLGKIDSQEVIFKVQGEVSLCEAYLPRNMLTCKLSKECNINKFFEGDNTGCQEDCNSDTNNQGNKIIIPKTNSAGRGIPIILRANTGEWRNIAYLLAGDKVEVRIGQNKHPSFVADIHSVTEEFVYNKVNNNFQLINADCTEGKKKYSAICGRYSPWGEHKDTDIYIESCKECKGCSCQECGISDDQCVKGERYCPEPSKYPGNPYSYRIINGKRECAVYNDNRVLGIGCENMCTYQSSCDARICNGQSAWQYHTAPVDCNLPIIHSLPQAYLDNGTRTVPDISFLSPLGQREKNQVKSDLLLLGGPVNKNSCSDDLYNKLKNRKRIYSWRSASYASDLKYKFSADGEPHKDLGSLCQVHQNKDKKEHQFNTDCYYEAIMLSNDSADKGLIFQATLPNEIKGLYLQYMIPPNEITKTAANSNGGYVLYLKQDGCVRSDGFAFSDSKFMDRGKIHYIIVPRGEDPNYSNKLYNHYKLDLSIKDEGKITQKINSNEEGYIWLKIQNDENDYKNSSGEYRVEISSYSTGGQFLIKVLDPLIKMLKGKINNTARTMFQNMICYKKDPTSSCLNFFNYIRGILTLYVIITGLMFLTGMLQFSVQDILLRVIKIALVSGLMNEKTFDFFNFYFYDAIIGFTDQMISNFSGYSMFNQGGQVSNPFGFLDAVMSKVFFSKTFLVQILALLSMGLVGILYFIMIFVALVILVITLLKAITIYVLALTASALLIALAPLFFTFMLFDQTWYLFDNWVRYLFRYLVEPVILMVGITVLTQLFTIYLDSVIGYSVCWKCIFPFKIPHLPGLALDNISDIEIFCINWFAPWGYDSRSGLMGLDMHKIVALIIIVYCMYGYVELSDQIVSKLCFGSPYSSTSATGMASPVSSALNNMLPSVNEQTISNMFSNNKVNTSNQENRGIRSGMGSNRNLNDRDNTSLNEVSKSRDNTNKVRSSNGVYDNRDQNNQND